MAKSQDLKIVCFQARCGHTFTHPASQKDDKPFNETEFKAPIWNVAN